MTQERKAGVVCVFNREGELLTWTRDIVERWKEHFEELLNPSNTSSAEEVESEDSEEASPVSLAEVAEVVKKILRGRVPGVNEICLEMRRALDIARLS